MLSSTIKLKQTFLELFFFILTHHCRWLTDYVTVAPPLQEFTVTALLSCMQKDHIWDQFGLWGSSYCMVQSTWMILLDLVITKKVLKIHPEFNLCSEKKMMTWNTPQPQLTKSQEYRYPGSKTNFSLSGWSGMGTLQHWDPLWTFWPKCLLAQSFP